MLTFSRKCAVSLEGGLPSQINNLNQKQTVQRMCRQQLFATPIQHESATSGLFQSALDSGCKRWAQIATSTSSTSSCAHWALSISQATLSAYERWLIRARSYVSSHDGVDDQSPDGEICRRHVDNEASANARLHLTICQYVD